MELSLRTSEQRVEYTKADFVDMVGVEVAEALWAEAKWELSDVYRRAFEVTVGGGGVY